jgi:PIN domain nuclease of toxin-antitoxin system
VNLLLDTCTFLWVIADDPALSPHAREQIADPARRVFLSPVSAWEIAVKVSLGRLQLTGSPDVLIPTERRRHGIESLELGEAASLHLTKLPELHREPFDSMLICQAAVHGLVLLTPDEQIRRYPVATAW